MMYLVLSQYSRHLIIYLTFFSSCGNIYYLGYRASPFITHTLSAIPGRHYPSPAVSLIFVYTCPAVFPNTCTLYPPPQSLPASCRLLIPPIVPVPLCPSSHLPCRPPKHPLSHVSHYNKKGLACRARRPQPSPAVPQVICPTPDHG